LSITAPFGQEVIRTILPHRPPLLLVDRVEELVPEKRIVCVKEVRADEYYLHRPPDAPPTFPLTILAEVVAQSGALLVLLRPGLEGKPIYFMAIDRFEVRRPIVPGETIRIEAEPVRMRTRFGSLRGTVWVGSEEVGHGLMRFAVNPDGDSAPSEP
jgi:3-hydroxyacyl-[acyl-carrier-protein] dehydratase